MEERKKISTEIETEVLIKSKRRCCVCFGINGDDEEKSGQIAHLDKNRNNNSLDNLAFLCLQHHDKYDSTTSQSKNYTKNEIKSYRDKLYKYFYKLYDNKFSSNDYYEYLNSNIKIESEHNEMKGDTIVIDVDNPEVMDAKLVEFELWNGGELELVINKIEMRNRLPFHYCREYWTPLPFKGLDKNNTVPYIRYMYNHFINFEIESKKYISLFYFFPQLRIGLLQKIYSLQFDFIIEVTIPSKSFNYEIPDVTREITKTIFFEFRKKDI
ncbi:hypothetical protein [Clostridium fungisolvens]|uniref:HNH endonuclease n=1 Tax=Clostridium fungisolvens TaxID=1604897 RepID=A0A6V8SLJ2_9CLOT|nr:hypothetical protein [Clostridium fungisolvens]GFP77435.1 hypothetical protein bsdtw1_03563 [Clostridium fungisolvens]